MAPKAKATAPVKAVVAPTIVTSTAKVAIKDEDIFVRMLRTHSSMDKGGWTLGSMSVGNKLKCFTCEDEGRKVKVPKETRIPAGIYELDLRTEGSMHLAYSAKYPGIHKGMIWLKNVPGFEWVYIHIGNFESNTEGCILVGNGRNIAAGTVSESKVAYFAVAPAISLAIIKAKAEKKKIYIEVKDIAA